MLSLRGWPNFGSEGVGVSRNAARAMEAWEVFVRRVRDERKEDCFRAEKGPFFRLSGNGW